MMRDPYARNFSDKEERTRFCNLQWKLSDGRGLKRKVK